MKREEARAPRQPRFAWAPPRENPSKTDDDDDDYDDDDDDGSDDDDDDDDMDGLGDVNDRHSEGILIGDEHHIDSMKMAVDDVEVDDGDAVLSVDDNNDDDDDDFMENKQTNNKRRLPTKRPFDRMNASPYQNIFRRHSTNHA